VAERDVQAMMVRDDEKIETGCTKGQLIALDDSGEGP